MHIILFLFKSMNPFEMFNFFECRKDVKQGLETFEVHTDTVFITETVFIIYSVYIGNNA